MNRLFSLVGATIGGYAGWWLGSAVGLTTSFILSIVGTGLGIYLGQRAARHYGG